MIRDKHKISSDIFKCQSKMLAAWKQGVVARILGPVTQIHVLVCFNASFYSNVYAVQCACTAALLQRVLKHLSALPSVLPNIKTYCLNVFFISGSPCQDLELMFTPHWNLCFFFSIQISVWRLQFLMVWWTHVRSHKCIACKFKGL